MNNIDKQYQELLQDILDNGIEKKDRTGTGTISVFGRQIRHKMSEGFPLLTTKKMAWKTMVTELLWFLRGDTNIKFLVDNDCHIWDGDAYKNYRSKSKDNIDLPENLYNKLIDDLNKDAMFPIDNPNRMLSQEEFINKIKTDDEFDKKWGSLGKIYGHQWRNWNDSIDQISDLIKQLKENPDSRRLLVSAWNPSDLPHQVLPPCHYGFQVYTRELSNIEKIKLYTKKVTEPRFPESLTDDDMVEVGLPTRAISLMWNQRSCDFPLGIPMNIASYGLLLEIIAKIVNMVPDELIGNFGDCHIYLNQIEGVKEQIGRDYTQEEIQEHLQQSGMDALTEEVRMEYVSKLPKRTREPMELPTLKLPKTDAFWNGFDVSLFGHLDPTDFKIENYQSHPKIFFPLSN